MILFETIRDILYVKNGLTRTYLEIELISRLGPKFSHDEYLNSLKDMMRDGDLIELRYINPGFNTEVPMYFLRGTRIMLNETNVGMVEASTTSL